MTSSANWAIFGVMFGVGAVIGVAPGTAQALSCEAPNYLDLPRDGAVEVPTNTLLWGYLTRLDQLLGPAGEVVQVDERTLVVGSPGALGGVSVLVPRASLQPNADYTILRRFDDEPEHDRRSTFRTGAGPSLAIPPPPTLISSETGVSAGWSISPTRVQHLEFEGFGDHELALIGGIVDLKTIVSLRELLIDEDSPEQGPPRARLFEWASRAGGLTVGIGDCVVWPPGAADRQDAQFAAFDLAGNVSSWVDVPIELPSLEEAEAAVDAQSTAAAEHNIQKPRSALASCSVTAAGSEGWRSAAGLALGLGLAIAARRARRSAGAPAPPLPT